MRIRAMVTYCIKEKDSAMTTTNANNGSAERLQGRRRSIQRPRVHVEVLSCLLEDIQSGVYQVGQKLPSERELMDEFGVGRPAVREALSALARMGLIEVSPGMRARVCRLTLNPLLREMRATMEIYSSTHDGWRQMHDLRQFFETAVARNAARHMTDEHRGELERILQRQRALLDNSEIREFAEADIDFHRYLVNCVSNSFLEIISNGFAGWLITPLYASMQVRKQSELAYNAHVRIYEALQQRDADAAEEAMRAHLGEMRGIYQVDVMSDTEKNR